MSSDRVPLGTKAQSLARLAGRVRRAEILPLELFDRRTWATARETVVRRLLSRHWAGGTLIVRSSALGEDSATASQAGRFLTVAGVRGPHELAAAVDKVFGSYDRSLSGDEVLVQPELAEVAESGVACTHEPATGAPYTVVSWSETPDAVTGGRAGNLRTWYGAASRGRAPEPPGPVPAVLALLDELRELTGEPRLDVEFAVTPRGTLILLQVRPLACVAGDLSSDRHDELLSQAERAVAAISATRPGVLGGRPVFGVMPDWNPAEIIGLRPRPLALSLYRELVTDEIWARARHRYGYRDLRGTSLLADVGGLPYVDVRVSITSLLPAALPDAPAARLADAWAERLLAKPHLHDKVESRVVVSSVGLAGAGRFTGLLRAGVPARDVARLRTELRRLTDQVVNGPLWTDDLRRVRSLRERVPRGEGVPALLARLRCCAEYGTLPFAGLARAAFIGTELLDDLVSTGVFSKEDRARFIAGLGLVSGRLSRDFRRLSRERFLAEYGHLRPGTYDIRSLRYDEDPDHYFDWSARGPEESRPAFRPSARQLARIGGLLRAAGLTAGPDRLLEFVGAGIRGRERAKFEFSRVLSDVLSEIRRLGERSGFSAEDMSFIEVDTLRALTGRAGDRAVLGDAIARGRENHERTRQLTLPPLLSGPQEVRSFTLSGVQPTFITQCRVRARVADVDAGERPDGAIALVSSADPGYDWLFARGIAGLITAFGGVNSHMSLRAVELGIPAVIGAGEQLFRRWSRATALDLDAANRHVAVLP